MPLSHFHLLLLSLAAAIYLELSLMGFKAWYDNRADDLTKEVRMVLACLYVARLAAATDAGGG